MLCPEERPQHAASYIPGVSKLYQSRSGSNIHRSVSFHHLCAPSSFSGPDDSLRSPVQSACPAASLPSLRHLLHSCLFHGRYSHCYLPCCARHWTALGPAGAHSSPPRAREPQSCGPRRRPSVVYRLFRMMIELQAVVAVHRCMCRPCFDPGHVLRVSRLSPTPRCCISVHPGRSGHT